MEAPAPTPVPAAPDSGGGDRSFWPAFAAGLKGKVSPSVLPYLHNPSKVTGVWKNGQLTLWTDSEFTRSMLNKPAILEGLARAAGDAFGGQPRVSIVAGRPPEEDLSPAPSQPSHSRRAPVMLWTSCWPLGKSLTTSSYNKIQDKKECLIWQKVLAAAVCPAWAAA